MTYGLNSRGETMTKTELARLLGISLRRVTAIHRAAFEPLYWPRFRPLLEALKTLGPTP